MDFKDWIFVGVIALFILIAMFILIRFVAKPTFEFYDDCDVLEHKIKTENDKDNQIEELFKLKDKSWHRSTGERLRELALMMEIKYDVEIIKR